MASYKLHNHSWSTYPSEQRMQRWMPVFTFIDQNQYQRYVADGLFHRTVRYTNASGLNHPRVNIIFLSAMELTLQADGQRNTYTLDAVEMKT